MEAHALYEFCRRLSKGLTCRCGTQYSCGMVFSWGMDHVGHCSSCFHDAVLGGRSCLVHVSAFAPCTGLLASAIRSLAQTVGAGPAFVEHLVPAVCAGWRWYSGYNGTDGYAMLAGRCCIVRHACDLALPSPQNGLGGASAFVQTSSGLP